MSDRADDHRRLILDQFTKQAVPFSEMPAHSNDEASRLLIDMARIGPDDNVLDVACGPGLVACPLAEVARHVTGIDITPAMIEQAQAKQQSKGLKNLTWLVGDAVPLPFPDAAFSVVVTRYSFHHFLDPKSVLAEMVRVCKPGGRAAVIDVFTSSPEQAEAYNRVEKLRDPSHIGALSLEELTGLSHNAGLRDLKTAFYKLDVSLEGLLARSFPNPGDADDIRRTFEEDIGVDRLGVGAHRRDGAVHFAFPIVVVVGRRSVKEGERERLRGGDMKEAIYIHGTEQAEQDRLATLNDLTNEAFLGFVGVSPTDLVLDVGSGMGQLARRLALNNPHGQVCGVERSEDQLAKARADLPNLHFQKADAHDLPFEDDAFDVVYCRYLLEHVSDPVKVLKGMRRVLKPGGRLYVQENNILANTLYPECPEFDRLWRCFATLQQSLGGDALIGKKLLHLLIEGGFSQVVLSVLPEVHYFGTPTFVPWIENLIGNVRSCERALVTNGLATAEGVRRAVEELRLLMGNRSGSAFFYWNRASAVK